MQQFNFIFSPSSLWRRAFFMQLKTNIHKSYSLALLLIMFAIAIPLSGVAQEQTKEVLYEYDMKYNGSSTKPNIQYQYILDYLIELMHKNPTWKLHIRGHVCCGPDQKISEKRAKNVYKFLLKKKIDASRLSYEGYSDTKPIVFPEKTDEDAHTNRRVDFMITKPIN